MKWLGARIGVPAALIAVLVVALPVTASAAPLGTVEEFSSGLNPGATPFATTLGPDGNVWFTEGIGANAAVGRITPAGEIDLFGEANGLSANAIPHGIASGQDGNVWFTDRGSPSAIGRVTPAGAITEFSAGLSREPIAISEGPAGEESVWFTAISPTPAIGRFITGGAEEGTITEFSVGLSPSSQPEAITLGPDGNLWFIDQKAVNEQQLITFSGSPTGGTFTVTFKGEPAVVSYAGSNSTLRNNTRIALEALPSIGAGNITVSGGITGLTVSFNEVLGATDLPQMTCDGSSLTPGGAGCSVSTTVGGAANAIGRITPSGTITEFTAGLNPGSRPGSGTSGGFPFGITSGPDGNLWFIDSGVTKAIGRITPSGTITEFTAGIQENPFFASIVAGPDGNVWYTDAGVFAGGENRIGRVTPSGSITEFEVANPPISGSFGSDGNLWFTMGGVEAIGRFGIEEEAPGPALTVTKEGTGSGTVASNPAGIDCGATCTAEFTEGSKVTLTASPSAGSLFLSWKGCEKGGVNGRQCTVTMDKAKTVVAKFIAAYDVTVDRVGSGLGKVQSSPGGVLCLANCESTSATFKEGVSVTLKAAPAKNFVFTGWTGDCSGTGDCSLGALGEDKDVGAEFTEVAKHDLTLSKSGGGNGTVKGKPAGINCGATCPTQTAAYYQGAVVELTATPGKGSSFGGWSGAGCSGTGTCVVTMSSAKSVTAEFK